MANNQLASDDRRMLKKDRVNSRGDEMAAQAEKPLAGMSALITGGGGGIGGASG